jgi:ABC-type amino acid transport substrate-binding protein
MKITPAIHPFAAALGVALMFAACGPGTRPDRPPGERESTSFGQGAESQSSNAVAEETPIIRIRVTDFAPLYYQDELGEWTGLEVELARALVLRAGFIPEFISTPWSRALKLMKEGGLELMANLSKTDERSEFIEWIGPERDSVMALIVRKADEHLSISSLDDLVDISISRKSRWGYQQDIFYSEDFNSRLSSPEFAERFEIAEQSQTNAEKLRAGRILGYFEEREIMRFRIANEPRGSRCTHTSSRGTRSTSASARPRYRLRRSLAYAKPSNRSFATAPSRKSQRGRGKNEKGAMRSMAP